VGRGNGQAGEVATYIAAIGASALGPEDLVGALARRNPGETVDVDGLPLAPDLLRLVPESLAFENGLLPVHRTGDLLFVAMTGDGDGLAELEHLLGLRLSPIAVTEIDVRGVLVKARQLLERRGRSEASAPAALRKEEGGEWASLDHLGIPDGILRRLRKVLAGAQGLILLTGPAGSGKSRTLRAIAAELVANGQRVAGLDARQGVAALEEALAADPDALAIDETPSPALAARALRAATEGRRVILALRGPDAQAGLALLAALKVDAHLAATATRAALNQRLLGRVCDACAESKPEDPGILEDLRLEKLLRGVPLRRGKGCDACGKTGCRGAVAVFEYGERGADGSLREGFQPLVADALAKLVGGEIPLREVTEKIPFTQLLQAADRLDVRKVNP
jgi:hypothetical protein